MGSQPHGVLFGASVVVLIPHGLRRWDCADDSFAVGCVGLLIGRWWCWLTSLRDVDMDGFEGLI